MKRSRQIVAVRDGKFVGKLGHGQFLQRQPGHF